MDRKDWNRIGLVAAVLLVPGGFLLGGAMAARRYRQAKDDTDEPAVDDAAPDSDQSSRTN